jgi:hypothetical protein
MIHIHETMLSDMYKDAHGFRPRNYPEMWTKEQLEKEYKYLEGVIKENMEREVIQHAIALDEFEARIDETISLGAENRKDAIRWLMQAEGLNNGHRQDIEHFFWNQGISFDMINKYADEIN